VIAERARVLAEGAGALAAAAALGGQVAAGKIACVVSGGNINLSTVAEIFEGSRRP
jgi:threonine dehydratase